MRDTGGVYVKKYSDVSGATKTTETAKSHEKGVFVVSVAPSAGHLQEQVFVFKLIGMEGI